jgi:hypothetical protein
MESLGGDEERRIPRGVRLGRMQRLLLLTAFVLLLTLGTLLRAQDAREARWWKGNTHTHTLWSDGDAAPEVAADWYSSHG